MSLLRENSYHILGLDTSADQKEVSKRSKEIITRLKVDDIPSYNLDLNIFEGFRTEHSVKRAVDKLMSPKNQIQEYFFWFQVTDDVDEQAVGLFRKGEYDEAARVWEHHSSSDTAQGFLYKKNLAILYSLLLYKDKKSQYLAKSVKAWKEILESDKFWNAFSKVYKLHDDIGADPMVVSDFRKNAPDLVSDIFADLTSHHKDQDFVSRFANVFGMKGKKMETDIVDPIYKNINNAIEELDKLRVSADGTVDQAEANMIKKSIRTLQEELNKLLDLGLYEDSRTKLLRDRAAAVVRKISIDLNNNLNETNMALGLLKIADKISGTSAFNSRIQQDLKTTQQNQDYKNKEERQKSVVDPIVADFQAGNSERAIQTINQYLYSDDTDKELKETLTEIKRTIEERVAQNGKPVAKAPGMHSINGIGTTIYGDTIYFIILFIPIIALGRYKVTDHGGNSYSFHGKLELHKWQKIYNWVVPGIIILWIMSNQ